MANADLLSAIDQAVAALKAVRKELATGKNQKVTRTPAKSPAKAAVRVSASKPVQAKRTMSEEGRQRIAAAQRKRWAAQKKAAKKAARA